jgi:murein DD-endopeptidase MepM/ murein hydrolase activator NlpD
VRRWGMRLLAALASLPLLIGATAPASAEPDPRWVFYTKDKHRYTSPWYAGAHRIMIPFGCTSAPYYSPDPRCRGERGFHHGLDIAMPCGTKLRAGTRLRVVRNDALGPAYGANPLLLRNHRHGFDLVIGHTRRVFVRPGDVVWRGTVIARASDDGAPDGCHLHFEKRAVGGGLASAVAPRQLLGLTRRR